MPPLFNCKNMNIEAIIKRIKNMNIEDVIKLWNEHIDRRFFRFAEIHEMDDEKYWDDLYDYYHSKLLLIVKGVEWNKPYVIFDEESQSFLCLNTKEEFLRSNEYGEDWLIEELLCRHS